MSEFKVEIRERSNPNEDYKRPELLTQAIAEVEAEVAKEREAASASDDSSSYESDSGDEDDEAQLLTPTVDSQIFRTLAAIRAKDPSLYEDKTTFFNPNEDGQEAANKDKKIKKEKKVTLKDYERDILLNHGGYVEDESRGVKEMTHREEQEQLKQAFKLAADSDSEDEEDDDEDDLLVKKEKTEEEKEAEEQDYRNHLLELMKDDVASKSALAEWSNYKTNPNVSKEDAFLMDYVLNKGWVDKGKGSNDKKKQKSADGEDDGENDLDVDKDEEYLDNVDCFESKYNFRFEEEGSSMIKTYPRDIEGSARRKESKRAKRRQREKLNKEKKKQEKMMEIKQMKNEKMKEIREKLREIQGITGNSTVGFEDIDFDGNFDPEAHDRKMQEIYNDDYYNADADGPNEKPVWNDDLDDEDIGFNMDADYQPEDASAGGKSNKLDGNDVNSEKFKQLMEEYYSLNYEDVIGGDTFTRFKYTKTEPENYGLTAEEILLADDAELNKYIGMKQLAPYRPEKKKQYEMRAFEKNQKYKKRELKKHLKEVTGKVHRQKRAREADEYEDKVQEEQKEQEAAEKEAKKHRKKRKHSKKSKKEVEA